ncbi:MAG: hypothetical protein Q8R39_00280 [bacterium]|nr:hypothetical protein [bacterium]MDZ4284550.1 hypothetical protein [Patescibacteria group bacterium]
MAAEENPGRIEAMGRALYRRGARFVRERRRLHQSSPRREVRAQWEEEGGPGAPRRRAGRGAKIFFLLSALFFLLAAGFAVYRFRDGGRSISSSNVEMTITGPVSIDAGEDLSLQVTMTNHNPISLESAELLIEYPEGVRQASDGKTPLVRFRKVLGVLRSGESFQEIVHSAHFGDPGSVHAIHITLEYRVAGSNAIFAKEKLYDVRIGVSPVLLTLSSVEEMQAGEEVVFTLDVTSNAASVLEDLVLVAEYPFGFAFASAEPKPALDMALWRLGDLAPEGKRRIRIRGTLDGEDDTEHIFRFVVGVRGSRSSTDIATPLVSAARTIIVRKPFLGFTVALGGRRSEVYAARPDEPLRVDLSWVNNLSVSITDVEIQATLLGTVLDKRSVSAPEGFYQSGSDTVTWNRRSLPALAVIEAGEKGQTSFSFRPVSREAIRAGNVTNPEMELRTAVSGRRSGRGGDAELLVGEVHRLIRFISEPRLSSRTLHFTGPLSNSGPIPPRVDRETTYTIAWSVTNTTNEVIDGEVHTTLPPYIRWLGRVYPADADIVFSPVGGEIAWRTGTLAPGTGIRSAPREVFFQVALVPSANQLEDSPTLVNEAEFTGRDSFAEVPVTARRASAVNTRFSTDPQYQRGQEFVVE